MNFICKQPSEKDTATILTVLKKKLRYREIKTMPGNTTNKWE